MHELPNDLDYLHSSSARTAISASARDEPIVSGYDTAD